MNKVEQGLVLVLVVVSAVALYVTGFSFATVSIIGLVAIAGVMIDVLVADMYVRADITKTQAEIDKLDDDLNR